MVTKTKLLKPKIDVVFHALFKQGNEDITKAMIQAATKEILRKEPKNELAQWVMFINDPNESEVSKIMEDNKEIEKAMNELEKISQDKELRRVAELREKAIRDEQNGLRHAKQEGKKEGKIEVTRKMIEKNIDIDTICELTVFTKSEIIKLK